MNFIKKHFVKIILLVLLAGGAIALAMNWDAVKKWYSDMFTPALGAPAGGEEQPEAKNIARVTSATPKLMAAVGGLR